MDTAKQQ